jgi:predicted nucleic acid-binding protein
LKKKRVLDAFALLAYLKGEKRGAPVLELLKEAERGKAEVLINQINLGEVYYIIARERSRAAATSFIEEILPQLPIEVIPNSFTDVIAAADIKAELSLPYADAFTLMTAKRESCPLVTGDQDFKKAELLVKVDWI